MAVVGVDALTLSDLAQRLDPNHQVAKIIEILNKKDGIVQDVPWVEGNLGTGHKVTIRTGLPTAAWRILNYGVPKSKSRTAQVIDTTGMLEVYSEVDKDLASLYDNRAAFLLSESKAFIEGMTQQFSETLFYGNTNTNPERFLGLSTRYSSLSAENGANIISGAGSGSDNTSIWLIAWSGDTINGIYPKGSQAGLKMQDLGQHTVLDAVGNQYEAYRAHFQWKPGLTLKDWRYVVRIANIDVSDLTKDGSGSSADVIDLMAQALEQIQDTNTGNLNFYCNRTVKSFLRRQISNKSNVNLLMDTAGGKHVMTFDGVPVKLCETLLSTEATVS